MPINTFSMCEAQLIALSGTFYTPSINLNDFIQNGYFSAYLGVTGNGTCKVEYQLSFDNINWVTGSSAVFTGYTKTSGLGSNGKEIASFTPAASDYMRFKITEIGAANSITITLKLAAN